MGAAARRTVRTEPQHAGGRLGLVASTIPLVVGLVATVQRAWVSDDAFITFRYIQQFERGRGLVYNAGERVEGYTHFLWLLLLAALHRIGFDVVELGRYLPILFHVATLVVLFEWSRRRPGPARIFVPLAAWGVALQRDMQVWASGGLETAAFTFFVTASALAASSATARPGLVAALAAVATLFRPEGILVTACLAVALAWSSRNLRTVATFAAVWVALVAPHFAWRWIYYHDWLPNTYWAKSAGRANWR